MTDSIVKEVLLTAFSYELIAIIGNYMNADAMDGCMPRRHNSVVYWTYFLTKSALYSLYYSAKKYGVIAEYGMAGIVWPALAVVLSSVVVYYTWRCEPVRLLSLSFVCEAVTTSCQLGAFMLVRLITGTRVDAFNMDLPTFELLLGSLFAIAAYSVARRPERTLLRWLNKEMERRQPLWVILLALIVMMTVLSMQNYWIGPYVLACVMTPIALLVFGPALYLKLRDTSLRERALRECAELSGTYDETVRTQLALLERDRSALEGHEKVLEQLGESRDDSLQRRIQMLEESYQHLNRASYCLSPGLDAVLSACVGRLETLGVKTSLSVTGEKTNQTGLVSVVYSVLGIAYDVAASSRDAAGSFVSLRVRPTDAGTLLRMETPASWGPLNARKVLKSYKGHGVLALDERRQGDSRVVLVLAEGGQND